jgi:hypothetical protein
MMYHVTSQYKVVVFYYMIEPFVVLYRSTLCCIMITACYIILHHTIDIYIYIYITLCHTVAT